MPTIINTIGNSPKEEKSPESITEISADCFACALAKMQKGLSLKNDCASCQYIGENFTPEQARDELLKLNAQRRSEQDSSAIEPPTGLDPVTATL